MDDLPDIPREVPEASPTPKEWAFWHLDAQLGNP